MSAPALRPAPAPSVAGCRNTPLLKLLALFFMLVDHTGMLLFPGVTELRLLGRIAFPLFAWCMVVGVHYTHSLPRYALRLLAVGILSQPIYHTDTFLYLLFLVFPVWTQGHAVSFSLAEMCSPLSIFFTLLLALLAIAGIRQKRFFSHVWAPALCLLTAVFVPVSYGWRGVTFILLLYMACQSRSALAAVMIAFCLFWGQDSGQVTRLFGASLAFDGPLYTVARQYVLRLQFFAILALPFMLAPLQMRVRCPKWLAYVFYPAHLALLTLLALLTGRL